MKKIYMLLFILAAFTGARAQTFHKYYSSPNSIGLLFRCIQTSDGGYASAGQVIDITSFDTDFLVVKTDASGNLSWSKKIPFSGTENFSDIVETPGGGIVVVGSSFGTATFVSDAVVVKYDATGTLLWSKSYNTANSSSTAKRIAQDAQGNLFVLGNISVSSAPEDYFIMKLDASGNVLDFTSFSTPDIDVPLGFIRNATTGEFYISGWYNNSTGENIHLIKVDSNMSVSWNVLMSGSTKYFCYDMKQKANGNILLAGRYDDGVAPYSVFLAEINAAGNQVWANNYAPLDSIPCYALGITLNGNNAGVTGIVEDASLIRGTLAFQVDNIGNMMWTERIGAAAGEFGSGYGINTTSDGGYIISGERAESTSSNSIVQLVKLTGTGAAACNYSSYPLLISSVTLPALNLIINTTVGTMTALNISLTPSALSGTGDACPVGIDEADAENIFSVYPNPSAGEFRIKNSTTRMEKIDIYNSLGEKVFQSENLNPDEELVVDAASWSSGIHFIRLSSGQKHFAGKIIIE